MSPSKALLGALMVLLAGCVEAEDGGEGGESTTTASSASGSDPCPTLGDDTGVPGWTKHGGQWAEVASQAGHEDVVCGSATQALSSLVGPDGPFTDFEAKVELHMLAGDSGAGLVLHFADEGNYNIVRYSIREQGWHVFTMVDGTREKRDAGSVMPPPTNPDLGQWVNLTVRSEGGHLTAFDGEAKVIDYQLPAEASHSGRVGYFLRDTGMVALFDGFSAKAP